MTQSTVTGVHPIGIPFDRRFFTEFQIDAIISAVGSLPDGQIEQAHLAEDGETFVRKMVPRRKALRKRLERAAQYWHMVDESQAEPTPRQLAEEFKAVETASNNLLNALHLPNMSDIGDPLRQIPPALRYGGLQEFAEVEAWWDVDQAGIFGATLLREAVQGVYRLRDWSADARRHNHSGGPVKRSERYQGQVAVDELFIALAEIWVEVFNGIIRTSTTSPAKVPSRPSGPMICFYSAALRPVLGEDAPTDEGIRTRIRRLRHMGKLARNIS